MVSLWGMPNKGGPKFTYLAFFIFLLFVTALSFYNDTEAADNIIRFISNLFN